MGWGGGTMGRVDKETHVHAFAGVLTPRREAVIAKFGDQESGFRVCAQNHLAMLVSTSYLFT